MENRAVPQGFEPRFLTRRASVFPKVNYGTIIIKTAGFEPAKASKGPPSHARLYWTIGVLRWRKMTTRF